MPMMCARNRVASISCSSGAGAAHSRRYRREYAGAARPRLRQRAIGSLDSLLLIRGKVPLTKPRNNCYPRTAASHAPQHSGTRKDPPESNLCSGGSGCTAMISTPTNVQTRAAPKRRGVGLRARSGVAVGTADRARSGVDAGTARLPYMDLIFYW